MYCFAVAYKESVYGSPDTFGEGLYSSRPFRFGQSFLSRLCYLNRSDTLSLYQGRAPFAEKNQYLGPMETV